jgi:hypothetical protein
MRHMFKMAILAGAALAAAGCGRQAAVNNVSANEVGQGDNQLELAPDATAVEAVNSTPPPAPPEPAANAAEDDPGAATSGGDTGGNSLDLETNTPGI